MSVYAWESWATEWELQEKVSFNGFEKQITVNSGVATLDIMADVYSAWVRWTAREPRFLPAIRYTGFDVIPGGRSGASFFLYNGWKLVLNLRTTKVLGVLFSDNYPTAYYDNETLEPLYPAEVSSVVNTVYSGGGGASITAADVWAYNNRSLTTPFPTVTTPPTVTQIRQEIDANSTKLTSILNGVNGIQTPDVPTAVEIANAVRTELEPELTHVLTLENQTSALSPTQATMILEMYELLGLDPLKPLIVTQTSRQAGSINQTIVADTNSTTVIRNT